MSNTVYGPTPTFSVRLSGLIAIEWSGGTDAGRQTGSASAYFASGATTGIRHTPVLVYSLSSLHDPTGVKRGMRDGLAAPLPFRMIPSPDVVLPPLFYALSLDDAEVSIVGAQSDSLAVSFAAAKHVEAPDTGPEPWRYINFLPDLVQIVGCGPHCVGQNGVGTSGVLKLGDGDLACAPSPSARRYAFRKQGAKVTDPIVPLYFETESGKMKAEEYLPCASEVIYNFYGGDLDGNVTISIRQGAVETRITFKCGSTISISSLPVDSMPFGMPAPSVVPHFAAFYPLLPNGNQLDLWLERTTPVPSALPDRPAESSHIRTPSDLDHCIMALVVAK